MFPAGIPSAADPRGLCVGDMTAPLLDAVTRLVELMAQPDDAALLAPLAVDEILIRLLRSGIGARVAQLGQNDTELRRIAQTVGWIREHYSQPVRVDELARLAHMSLTSFHQRFRAVTSMTPLQYLKTVRLAEARRLMMFQGMDAGSTGRHVGYLSKSQFSREYARLFGNAPTRDIAQLRKDQADAVGAAAT